MFKLLVTVFAEVPKAPILPPVDVSETVVPVTLLEPVIDEFAFNVTELVVPVPTAPASEMLPERVVRVRSEPLTAPAPLILMVLLLVRLSVLFTDTFAAVTLRAAAYVLLTKAEPCPAAAEFAEM